MRIKTFYIAFLLGLLLNSCQALKLMQFKTIEVNDQLVIATGAGGNSAILMSKDENHILIVDTKMGRGAKKLYKWTKKQSNNAQITIVNTHFHGDHTKGNHLYEKTGKLDKIYAGIYTNEQWKAETKREKPPKLVELPIGSHKMIHFYGENVHLFSMGKGHTWSDVVVYFERAKTLHIGDLVFNDYHPVIHAESGASVIGWINGLEDILTKFEEIQVIPGHGAITDRTGIERQLLYLQELTNSLNDEKSNKAFRRKYRHLSGIPLYSGMKYSLKAIQSE